MINLKEVYGKRYRVALDASYDSEQYKGKSEDLPWYYEIQGKSGQIYLHSDTHLQAWVGSSRLVQRLLRALPAGWSLIQNASDGGAFSLPNADIGTAFKWIKPRRRRVMTPEQAKAASERIQAWKFPAHQSAKRAEICDQAVSGGRNQ